MTKNRPLKIAYIQRSLIGDGVSHPANLYVVAPEWVFLQRRYASVCCVACLRPVRIQNVSDSLKLGVTDADRMTKIPGAIFRVFVALRAVFVHVKNVLKQVE